MTTPTESNSIEMGSIIRIQKPNNKGYRCWKVVGHHLGAVGQEDTWALRPLDQFENEQIQIPCILLETHPLIGIIQP